MTLQPLLTAPAVIQVHAYAAFAAFALGLLQLLAPKGTLPHRRLGWLWAALLATVAATSFWIHEIRLWGPWSPIHLLSVLTLVALPAALYAARRHRVARHRRGMLLLFFGALVVAGAFTFYPGRILYRVVAGG